MKKPSIESNLRLKVLPLANWHKLERLQGYERTLGAYKQITPTLGRPGRYLRRLKRKRHEPPQSYVWFELRDGRAFEEDRREDFVLAYELDVAEHLTPEQQQGIVAICHTNLATRAQRKLNAALLLLAEFRGLRIDAAKARARFKRFKRELPAQRAERTNHDDV